MAMTAKNPPLAPPMNGRRESEKVVEAANAGRKIHKLSSNLSQLSLANMQLHGRDHEMKLLKGMLREFTKTKVKDIAIDDLHGALPQRHNLLLIAGASGTGKSALVKQGLEKPAQKMGIVFASGKFDLNKSSALPFSAFSAAMSSLIKQVIMSKHADAIKGSIMSYLKADDMARLIDVMPGCSELFTFKENHDSLLPVNRHRVSIRAGKHVVQRLQYSIRLLLKAICTHLKGVVIFIDDLQWSDGSTIDLLKSLFVSNDIPSLLLVGAYREDEVSESHPLMLQINGNDEGVQFTTIKIGSLTLENVKSLLAEALRMEGNEDAVSSISNTIHKKTDGNAFYVLVFLKSLYDEDLLRYNFGAMKWLWDDSAVEAKFVTDNVATILINKLKRLPESLKLILEVAACLKSRFSISTVATIIQGLSPKKKAMIAPVDNQAVVASLIDQLEGERLVERERGSTTHCHLSHDQVQKAALELIPDHKRNSFRGEIGDIMMKSLNTEEVEANFFEVVSLRNSDAVSLSEEEQNVLAQMNLKAGLVASMNAAFDTAVIYYSTGRKLLGANAWDTDGDTMLKLCSEEANACYVNGDFSTMKELLDEVLSKDISVEDKFKAFEVKVLALSADFKEAEAINTIIDVRRQLGLRTPANKPVGDMIVVKEYLKTSRLVGKRTAEDIASLPILEDKRLIMGQRMLELLVSSCYQCQPTMFPLVTFLMVNTSIKHGVNASSCAAFGLYGLLLSGAFGKLGRGRDMARAVELLLENPDHGRMQSMASFTCEGFIYHWTAPLQGTLAPLLAGYKNGLEIGDIESAAINLSTRSIHLWYSSRPLDGVLHELQTNYDVLATQLKQSAEAADVLPYLVAAKKLRGISSDTDFDDILKDAVEHNNQFNMAVTTITQLEWYVILQDMDSAASLLEGTGKVRDTVVGNFAMVRFTVLEGLVNLKVAQTHKSWRGRRKHKKRAEKSMKMIRTWLKGGNVNLVHAMHLLSAEHEVLQGNKVAADEQFKLAISVASKNGFMQDRGLAHELSGRYKLSQGDKYWARYHFECAEESFAHWGATSKAEQLREQKGILLGE